MAGRHCKICYHAERAEIETAIIRGDSKRSISVHFGIAVTSIHRHIKNHMIDAMAETEAVKAIVVRDTAIAGEQARQNGGLRVMEELERCFRRVNLMFDACDEWLRDPLEPGKYFIGPRATEIDVLYTERDDDGNVERCRDNLQNLLDQVNEVITGGIVLVQSRYADPREMLLKASKGLQGHMNFLARLRDQLGERDGMDTATSEAWAQIRQVIIEELAEHPEIRIRIAERLEQLGA